MSELVINAPYAHDFQNEAASSFVTYYTHEHKTGNPLVCLPTGTGKSFVIAAFNEWFAKTTPTGKIINLTHVKELIQCENSRKNSGTSTLVWSMNVIWSAQRQTQCTAHSLTN